MAKFTYERSNSYKETDCPPCPAPDNHQCKCGCGCNDDSCQTAAGLAAGLGALAGFCLGGPIGAVVGFFGAGLPVEAICKSMKDS